jgi:molecular chaperone HtpG
MQSEIKIGKYTLESLTTGMYTDPKIIYREYIQNSVDAIEEAINNGYLKKSDAKIEIIIDQDKRKVTIYDNGSGVKSNEVYNTLTDIGNSKKKHSSNRGFRGIGRLGGLSYCDKLVFTTSYNGENIKSTIVFNCKRLRELLVPGEYDHYNLTRVIREVTSFYTEDEDEAEHYFIVEMDGIGEFSVLLDTERIESYVRQVGPVPYSKSFSLAINIKGVFEDYGLKISEFPIYIGTKKDELHPIFKPNKDSFLSDMTKKLKDTISDINIFEIRNEYNDLMAIGWYAECSWLGGIIDKEISGLRMRKGNILIGDSRTLSPIFKEERFNGWTQGEIFVLTDKLIPNARRDDFEQNDAYHYFINQLTQGIGVDISRKIREASKQRNNPVIRKVKEAKRIVSNAITINKQGFNSDLEKNLIEKEIKENLNIVSNIKTTIPEHQKIKEETIRELTNVLDITRRNGQLKLYNIKHLGKKEMDVLRVVSNVLTRNLTKECVDMLLDEIIEELKK